MNKLIGTIKDVQSSGNIALIQVEVDGDVFSSLVLEGAVTYRLQEKVALLFKETEVGLAKNLSGQISLRNRFPATIKKIEKGPILAKVTLKYKNNLIDSIISAQSAGQMKLRENEEVEWLVKSSEVTLMKEPHD